MTTKAARVIAKSLCAAGGLKKPVERLEDRVLLSSWYVAASGGVEGNPGTLAQPFPTIQDAANVAQPGDNVFIETGVYHETVKPVNSGMAGAPITYQPYNGQSVTIDGADAITGWTQYSGSIYQATQTFDLGDGNNQVFAGSQMLTEARWPNTSLDPLHITTASITSTNAAPATQDTPTSATINNSALNQPAGFWVGATIHLTPGQQWIWQTGTVTASSPGSITYSYTQLTQYEVPKAGNPFYLTGKFSQLDAPGEFYHDATSNTLYVWMPDGSVPTHIESKSRQYAFDLSGLGYINITGVNIHAASITTDASSNHINIGNLTATYVSQQMDNPYPWGAKNLPGTTGFLINGTNITISNVTITDSSGNGIYLGGSNNTVQDCTISEVDYAAGDEAAVNVRGTGNTVSHNLIFDTGRSGVTFYFSPQTMVFNNVIHDIGVRTSDAGGVYAWKTDGMGSEVAYNIIYNLYGGGYGNSGILLDNNCLNMVVDHNVIYNADAALKMNGVSTDDDVYNNTLLAATSPPVFPNALIGSPTALIEGANPSMPGCNLVNNIFIGPAGFASGATHTNNLTSATSAKFVDAAAANYQLQAGSAAIDAGAMLPPYTNGFVGAAPDIGAYEFGAAPFQAGVPPQTVQLVATPPPGQAAVAGTSVSIQLGSFTATGTTASFSVTVHWGDSSADTVIPMSGAGPIPATSHTFASAGNFNPSITVSDSAGHNSTAVTFAVAVSAAAPVAAQLAFAQQPTGAMVGVTLIPAVTVDIEDASGNIVATGSGASGSVTVSLTTPAGATLSGIATVAAQNGVATFSDLSISAPGTYTLTASATGLAGMVSQSFTILAPIGATATTLFTSNASALEGALLIFSATVTPTGQSFAVPTGQVNFYDGQTILGAADVQSNGTAQFSTADLPAGAHSITASYGGDSSDSPSVSAAVTQNVAAPSPDSPNLVASVAGARLPAVAIEGAKFKSALPVLITNQGGGVSSGKFLIRVFAATRQSLDASAVPLLSLSRTARLAVGASRMFRVTPGALPGSLANGSYYLLVQVTDSAGFSTLTPIPSAMQVQAPFVALSVQVDDAIPGTLAPGKFASISIPIANSGNVTASGRMVIELGLSIDGTTVVSTLANFVRNVTIKPGATLTLRLRFRRPPAQAAGQFFPSVSISQKGVMASTIGEMALIFP
jgi:hypothetical protein